MMLIERTKVTQENAQELREKIQVCDIQEAIVPGAEIEAWDSKIMGTSHIIVVFHDTGRAAHFAGSDSDWGEWDEKEQVITLDEKYRGGRSIIIDQDAWMKLGRVIITP